MSKLGLYRQLIQGGAACQGITNDGPWARYVFDPRGSVADVFDPQGITQGLKPGLFLVQIPQGTLIAQYTPIMGGRMGDALVWWLYVPCDCGIKPGELKYVLDALLPEMQKSGEPDMTAINTLLANEYAVEPPMMCRESSRSGRVGLLVPQGQYTAEAILGYYRCQPVYANYRAVAIAAPDRLRINAARCAPIDLRQLRPGCIIKPGALPAGVTMYIVTAGGEMPFDRPVCVPAGEQVKLVYRRNGYADVHSTIVANGKELEATMPATMPWKQMVRRDMIDVVDATTGQRINGCNITVNGLPLSNQGVQISNDNNARVRVEADGYFPFMGLVDFSKGTARIALRAMTRNEKAMQSGGIVLRQWMIWVAVGVIFAVGFGAGVWVQYTFGDGEVQQASTDSIDTRGGQEIVDDGKGLNDSQETGVTIEDQLNYLNGNQNWTKAKMKELELMKLWDGMYNYDVNLIKQLPLEIQEQANVASVINTLYAYDMIQFLGDHGYMKRMEDGNNEEPTVNPVSYVKVISVKGQKQKDSGKGSEAANMVKEFLNKTDSNKTNNRGTKAKENDLTNPDRVNL